MPEYMLSTRMEMLRLTKDQDTTAEPRGILDLNPDILLLILEQLPDLESLKNAVFANKQLYQVFKSRENTVATSVLKNGIPKDYHSLILICQRALGGHFGVFNMNDELFNQRHTSIDRHLDLVVEERRQVAKLQLTPKEATEASRLHKILVAAEAQGIVTSTNHIDPWEGKELRGLQTSFARTPGIPHKPEAAAGIHNDGSSPQMCRDETIRAMYLWHILMALLRGTAFNADRPEAAQIHDGPPQTFQQSLLYFQWGICWKLMTCQEFMQVSTIHHCLTVELCRWMAGTLNPYYVSAQDPKDVIATLLLGCHASMPFLTNPDLDQLSWQDPFWMRQLRKKCCPNLMGLPLESFMLDTIFPKRCALVFPSPVNAGDPRVEPWGQLSSSSLARTMIRNCYDSALIHGSVGIQYPEYHNLLSESVGRYIIREAMPFWSAEECRRYEPWVQKEMRAVVRTVCINRCIIEQDPERMEALQALLLRMR